MAVRPCPGLCEWHAAQGSKQAQHCSTAAQASLAQVPGTQAACQSNPSSVEVVEPVLPPRPAAAAPQPEPEPVLITEPTVAEEEHIAEAESIQAVVPQVEAPAAGKVAKELGDLSCYRSNLRCSCIAWLVYIAAYCFCCWEQLSETALPVDVLKQSVACFWWSELTSSYTLKMQFCRYKPPWSSLVIVFFMPYNNIWLPMLQTVHLLAWPAKTGTVNAVSNPAVINYTSCSSGVADVHHKSNLVPCNRCGFRANLTKVQQQQEQEIFVGKARHSGDWMGSVLQVWVWLKP